MVSGHIWEILFTHVGNPQKLKKKSLERIKKELRSSDDFKNKFEDYKPE